MRERHVLGLEEIDSTQVALVGGKAASLGELARIDGVRVPAGFCVTTDAFRRMVAEAPAFDDQLDRLSHLGPDDQDLIRTLSAEIRRDLEAIPIPDDLGAAITSSLARLGEEAAHAVRSSATSEDLPRASFAGQHDTYLGIVGSEAILQQIIRCWASLFSERAVTYRRRNGFDDRKVRMAVVVQRMVFPQAAGILFTADPLTSNRKVVAVEASVGRGEDLVSGRVNADLYRVRDGEIVARTVATERLATRTSPAGGTQGGEHDREGRPGPALTDAQVVRLAQLGRRIETHFAGRPQDIEWCLVDDGFQIIQSRPITTLFPIPATGDQENHVFVSVGHQQMMTDPMRPLGVSIWQLTTPRPMYEAGGRLFVDVAPDLASAAGRARLLALGRSDPLIGGALQNILERGDLIPESPDESPGGSPAGGAQAPVATDPAIVTDLIRANHESIAALKRDIRARSGPALLDFIQADIQELRRILFDPRSHQVFMSAMEASAWLNERLQEWLGEKNAADTLTRSVPHNVTSEMGLALLDVADVIRPHAEVVAFLEQVEHEGFLEELPDLAGGREAQDAIRAFLEKYGMRCAGEIDITNPRWSESPSALVRVILGNIRNFEPGAGERRFEQGRREASAKEQELLARLRALPDGDRRADETKRMIDRVRTFIGYREYPKYGLISRYFVYKRALLEEAGRLVQAGVLREKDDIFYVTFPELHEVVRMCRVDHQLIDRRRDAFRSDQALIPPRVFTSDGEVLDGAYRRGDLPAGALAGLPVSAGVIEGRARVILDLADADVEPGDILVTAYTDPGWSLVFPAIAGLVTEVGGVMTHGAVIAREYGLPAVAGVEHATRLIRDGQRIRVNGTGGYVEILP